MRRWCSFTTVAMPGSEKPDADDTIEMLTRTKTAVDVPVGIVTFDPAGGESGCGSRR